FMTAEQIARCYFTEERVSTVRRYFYELGQRGLVRCVSILAHPELMLPAPLIAWKAGDNPPDFNALSRQCRSRWTQDVTTVSVYTATQRTANLMGGFSGLRSTSHTHDLHVGLIYTKRSPLEQS